MNSIEKSYFGKLPDGDDVETFKLKNSSGIEINIITYGGIITSIKVPDKRGKFDNVVLGFNTLDRYLKNSAYLGAIIGRFANRIANAIFKLDDVTCKVASNLENNHIHGGNKGFDKVMWGAKTEIEVNKVRLILYYLSKNGEENYPGNLNVTVIYSLTNDNALEIEYKATTDKKTIINLTQHSYFNLSGNYRESILGHKVKINANHYLPVDNDSIPTGIIADVVNTPYDFRKIKTIEKGYDHCWVLNKNPQEFAAKAYHPSSGRVLEVFTTEPGIQFYTGNFINEKRTKTDSIEFKNYSGFCFETQHFPNSPNEPKFPSVILNPDETYYSKTVFKFTIQS
jgi:aldose 1-epimerase